MRNEVDRPVPRQRTKDLVVRTHGDGTLILDRRTDTAHYLPPEVTQVWGACTGGNSLVEVAAVAGINEQIAASAVDQLMTLDLLEAPAGINRRKFLTRSALVGAGVLTVPVIETVAAAPAWAAGTVGTVNIIETCTPNKTAASFAVGLVGFSPKTSGYSFTADFATNPPGPPNPAMGSFGTTSNTGSATSSKIDLTFGYPDTEVVIHIFLNNVEVATFNKILLACNAGTPGKYGTTYDPPGDAGHPRPTTPPGSSSPTPSPTP